jgi:hypothetical protein
MTTTPDPLFDPLTYPARVRSMQEWAVCGPTPNWWCNLVASSIVCGKAHVVLKSGTVLCVTYAGDGPIEVTELPVC